MSFDPSLPTDRDKVRLYIGDTDPASERLSDDTIDGVLALERNPRRAAARCAQILAAKFATLSDVRGMHVAANRSNLYRYYSELARKLFAQAATQNSFVKLSDDPPVMLRGMDDNND